MKRTQTTLRIPPELLAWLDDTAEREGTTRTRLVERLLTEAMSGSGSVVAPDGRAIEHARQEGEVVMAMRDLSDPELGVLAGSSSPVRDAVIFVIRKRVGRISPVVQRQLGRLAEAELARRGVRGG